jgi:hypothetical protein
LGVWRRLGSLPKTTKAGTSPRTPYLFTQLKNAVEEATALLMQSQATLMQNQSTLMQNQVEFLARLSEMGRVNSGRFARLEKNMETIIRVLSEHAKLLEALPEAIRQKIGFKSTK